MKNIIVVYTLPQVVNAIRCQEQHISGLDANKSFIHLKVHCFACALQCSIVAIGNNTGQRDRVMVGRRG